MQLDQPLLTEAVHVLHVLLVTTLLNLVQLLVCNALQERTVLHLELINVPYVLLGHIVPMMGGTHQCNVQKEHTVMQLVQQVSLFVNNVH